MLQDALMEVIGRAGGLNNIEEEPDEDDDMDDDE